MIDPSLTDAISIETADSAISKAAATLSSAPELLSLLFIGALLTLMVAEKKHPHRQPTKALLRESYLGNIGRFLVNDFTLSMCRLPALCAIAAGYGNSGLLSGMEEGWLKTLTALVLLDLVMYGWHAWSHHCDALWMLHRVHHSDHCPNVTTGLRYHIGELVLETGVRAAFVVVAGISVETLLICQGLMSLFILLHHSNIQLPAESLLARLIVVPSLHRTHHSVLRSEHDSNYGAVLSIWDRLFCTFKVLEPKSFGLPAGQSAPTQFPWPARWLQPLLASPQRALVPIRIVSRRQQSNLR